MANACDVAKYILEQRGPMSAMKLQKLVYYCQAWSLVWDERPLFPEAIKAWGNGPVVPALWRQHKGLFTVTAAHIEGDSTRLTADEKETIDTVLAHYGDKSAQYLIALTHSELPWQQARGSLPPEATKSPTIPLDDIANYYSSLK